MSQYSKSGRPSDKEKDFIYENGYIILERIANQIGANPLRYNKTLHKWGIPQVMHSWVSKMWNVLQFEKYFNWDDYVRPFDVRAVDRNSKIRRVVFVGYKLKVTGGIRHVRGRKHGKKTIYEAYPRTCNLDGVPLYTHGLFDLLYLIDQLYDKYENTPDAKIYIRAIVVYDDKSYDTVSGNAWHLWETLELHPSFGTGQYIRNDYGDKFDIASLK